MITNELRLRKTIPVNSLVLSSLEISGYKSAGKCLLQDQDKQQKSFFVTCFPVKYSDWLVTTPPK